MSVIEIKFDPSSRDLKIFCGLWLLFFGALGCIGFWRPEALVGASIFLVIAVAVSIVLNGGSPRFRQVLGFLLPLAFYAVGESIIRGVSPWTVAYAVWGIGAAVGLLIWLIQKFARTAYIGWMSAAEPIGWTVSHLLLGIVFYLVITPIGLIMRLLGRDPMQRKLKPNATTYWEPRAQVADIKRYFRQF